MYFEFERLDVYKVSLEFVATADEIAERLPPGRAYLKDQLRRAANSIPANIAEGVGESTPREKVRFHRMARRSAVERASHLFVIRRLGLVEEDIISAGLEQLCRIVAMLTSMAKRVRGRGAGEEDLDQPSGSGSGSAMARATRTGKVWPCSDQLFRMARLAPGLGRWRLDQEAQMRRRVPSPSFPGLLLAAGSTFLLLAACTPEEEVVPLTGISAFKQMRKDRNHVPPTPFDSILSVMAEQSSGSAKPGDSAIEPEQPVANLLRKTTKAKLRLDPQKFDRPPASFFVEHRSAEKLRKLGKPGGVDVGALKHAEYHVPNVTSIPVRNQGERGTCASFAGIGHLEYLTLKRYGLRTMDLSEQRFYLMSRPDCARTGCVVDDEGGSWYGDGFQASKDSAAPPGDNIPLEADCPYNPRPGRNEMQIPQLTSCARGAAKVRGWRTVATPQEVVDVLEDEGLPVLWASPLSDNWFENKGLITYREAGSPGNVMHAGGHAYLLV
ncbi:MAG: four helix bundle protein, partial [Deltaproteobacteria bacterium]|nr:four helix bundle protein [Deltaproteobacteria bacterium]